MPALLARWPAAAASLAQSAAHCAAAAALLTEEAELVLESMQAGHPQRLRIDRLREVSEAQACNVVRLWLRRQQLPPLPRRRLMEALHQIHHARPDADLRIAWNGMELRRFRDELWLLKEPPGVAPQAPLDWDGEERRLGAGLGRLRRRFGPGGIDPSLWTEGNVQIAYRHMGLRCRPAGRAGRRSFKKLAQECDIPPWLRAITPIVLIDGRPAAIANCCVCEPFAAPVGEDGWIVSWQPD
jgi:tRNA(Ile)-lysidine synthase